VKKLAALRDSVTRLIDPNDPISRPPCFSPGKLIDLFDLIPLQGIPMKRELLDRQRESGRTIRLISTLFFFSLYRLTTYVFYFLSLAAGNKWPKSAIKSPRRYFPALARQPTPAGTVALIDTVCLAVRSCPVLQTHC
jgi:hypothetical protein